MSVTSTISTTKASMNVDSNQTLQAVGASWGQKCFRWVASKVSSYMGAVIHGSKTNSEVKALLESFAIDKLLKDNKPFPSPVLSDHSQNLILKSFSSLERIIDTHLHVLGYDESNFLHPDLQKGAKGVKFSVIQCAASGNVQEEGSTQLAIERLQLYARHFPRLEAMVLPIHPAVTSDGSTDWEHTGSYLTNEVAFKTASTFSSPHSKLMPAISIHPFEKDALEKLEKAYADGIYLVKWMPPQGIKPDDEAIVPFYQKMKELRMTLIAHSGPEHAVPVPDMWQEWGNPIYFEKPLKLGVNVILAHCGHKEHWGDFEALALKAYEENWPGLVYGDLAAMLHYGPDFAKALIKLSQKPFVRLYHGSDFPYTQLVTPGQDPYDQLCVNGLIDKNTKESLTEIRKWNPLLANFVAIRSMEVVTENGEKLQFPLETFTGQFEGATLCFCHPQTWSLEEMK